MRFRQLKKEDLPLLSSLERKAFPPDTSDQIDSVHDANPDSQSLWIDSRRNLSYVYENDKGETTGVIATTPISQKGWAFIKDPSDADVDEYALVDDKLYNPGDSEIGLYIYMIKKIDPSIQNFTKKAYKHVFSEVKNRFGLNREQIICIAGYSVSPIAINIAFNKLSRMEVKPLDIFMMYNPTGDLVYKEIDSIEKSKQLLSEGYIFRNRCRLTAVTPNDPSEIWTWFAEA